MPSFPVLRRPLAAIALAVLVAPLGPVAAQDDAATIGDIRRQREAARDAEAEALEELELLELEDERIGEVVDTIQQAVDAQRARVDGARQRLDDAEIEVRAREAAAAEADADIVDTIAEIRLRAVDAFIGVHREAEPWLASDDINGTAVRLSMIDFAAGSDRDLLDRLRTRRAELEEHVRAGEEARAEAEALRLELEDELAVLEDREAVQADIQAELRSRIDAWEREADQRAQEAEELTQLIRQKQTEQLGFAPGDPGAASVEGFIVPTNASIGSGFGLRVHPIFGRTRMHSGVDMGGPTGQPIWAAKEGRVIFAGRKGGYGNAVIIQHEGNVATLYAHLSGFQTSEGDWVDQGEVVGLMGSTGWSTGPHLHFEVRIDGVPKDPVLFLPV